MEEPDRLSELPQSLIHHILSFLPLKDAVSTTILSKAWVNLWTTVPCLNLIVIDDGDEDEDEDEEGKHYMKLKRTERLVKFFNRALILWKGVKILKFKIDVPFLYGLSLASDVNVWALFAVNNRVQELEIITYEEELRAPQCLYSCSSLRKLSVVGFNFNAQITGPPSWNQLKSLKINVGYDSCYSEDLITQILLGSPKLEVFELDLPKNYDNLCMTSTSLKKMKIKNNLDFMNGNPFLGTLIICCPNLRTLEISGFVGRFFFADISSLIDATLDLYTYYRGSPFLYELLGEPLKQWFSAIQQVEKITLSDLAVQVFGASHKKCLHSPLPNVKYLKLDRLRHIQLSDMIDLLEILPNLKMLVIKHQTVEKPLDNIMNYMEFESNLFKPFLLELKTIEISSCFYDISIFWFVEFLLKHAVKLEKMVLRSIGFMYRQNNLVKISQKKLFEISEKLMSIPRSSPTAKVILDNILYCAPLSTGKRKKQRNLGGKDRSKFVYCGCFC